MDLSWTTLAKRRDLWPLHTMVRGKDQLYSWGYPFQLQYNCGSAVQYVWPAYRLGMPLLTRPVNPSVMRKYFFSSPLYFVVGEAFLVTLLIAFLTISPPPPNLLCFLFPFPHILFLLCYTLWMSRALIHQRNEVLYHMHKQCVHMLLLQDTKFKINHISTMKQWYYTQWFHSTNPEENSRGVMVTIHKFISASVVATQCDYNVWFFSETLYLQQTLETYFPNQNQACICKIYLDASEGLMVTTAY